MTSTTTFQLSSVVRLLLLSISILSSYALRRGSSITINSANVKNNNLWGTNVQSPGWSIEKDSASSNANKYHVIGASRSGFYLSDDDLSEEATVKKLVPCTRYGQRVPKGKKGGHGATENEYSSKA